MCCGDSEGGGSGIVAWFTSWSLIVGLGDGEHCESAGSGVEKNRRGRGTDVVDENELVDVGVVGVVESFVGSKRGKGQVSRAARDDRNSFLHCQAVEDNELGG